MSENGLQAIAPGIQRHKSFKDKIQDYHGVVKGGIERTKSLFMDAKHDEAAKRANLSSTQKIIDFRQKQRDYRLAIDHMAAEYATAKETSCIVRYGKMKLMVKRILMQESELSKVNPPPQVQESSANDKGALTAGKTNSNANSGQLTPQNGSNTAAPAESIIPPGVNRQHKDIVAKLQKLETMSRLEIVEDTKKMDEELNEIANRLSQVRTAIQRLDEEYAEAKQFAPWDRYMMMKKMIKQFVTCKNILSSM